MGSRVDGAFHSDSNCSYRKFQGEVGTVVSEAEGTGHVGEGYQGGDFEPGEEEEKEERGEGMARRRGWALAEHFRPKPVFLSEYQNPTDFFLCSCSQEHEATGAWLLLPQSLSLGFPSVHGKLGLDLRGPFSGPVACYQTRSCPSSGGCPSSRLSTHESPSTREFSL